MPIEGFLDPAVDVIGCWSNDDAGHRIVGLWIPIPYVVCSVRGANRGRGQVSFDSTSEVDTC